jgi:hypothetical protein
VVRDVNDASMVKRAPLFLGTISGLACGIYLTYWMPPDDMPWLSNLLTGMVRFMMEQGCPNAQAVVFAYCGLPLLCATLGAGAGLTFTSLLRVIQRARTHGDP